ncbi:MAG: hypothetical protein JOZ69_19960 [Myxococcales bacterium]|nr:hypothetical protein [Myxococcales bacterium]
MWRAIGLASAALLLAACDKEVLVGADGVDAGCSTDAGALLPPLTVPWSNGFENGLGDWDTCYGDLPSNSPFPVVVTSPVHTGTHAAMFTIDTSRGLPGQSRCKKTGVLPAAAYYGAWFYIAALVNSETNWNLLHFQGMNLPGPSATCVLNLWDVSLTSLSDGGLSPTMLDFLRAKPYSTTAGVPIKKWFHLVVFLRRATDATGQFTVFLDDQVLLDLRGISTDASNWGEWHVGDFAAALSPSAQSIYVDDVSISTSGP